MPYHVGEKGSNGCSGYPVVKEGGEVMGCHETEESANNQVQALYANEAQKADTPMTPTQTNQTVNSTGVGIKRPEQGRKGGVLQSGIRAQAVKKPKKVRRGRSPYPTNEGGVTSVSDSGTSMGSSSKSDDKDFWAGSAFGKVQ
jgi:hypothetical protein